MSKLIPVLRFPMGAESNGFLAALSSALIPCLGITDDTPYWCGPNGRYCNHCSDCSTLCRHQEMLYHTLLTASGLAFTFDYPEDDSVSFHTMPNTPIGWRWREPFVETLMDFAGVSYRRYTAKSVAEMHDMICQIIDAGYTALIANHGQWADETAWSRCWKVICGYTDDGIFVMHHGGTITTETEGVYEDWIVITGKVPREQTYQDILKRIHAVLTDPSHNMLEAELYSDLSNVTQENAVRLAYKVVGINGVPIETRWHAAEAFCSCDNLLSSLLGNSDVKSRLSNLFFFRYIANGTGETHGTCWNLWDALRVGPETGYMPTDESFALIQKPEVQEKMKQLWKTVFDNDRAVAEGIRQELNRCKTEKKDEH